MPNLRRPGFAIRWLLLAQLILIVPVSGLHAQSVVTPTVALPKATYSPKPVYRPEWARQGLRGKGVVLVTIDPATGKVSGVQIEQSTGNPQLDGAALQAYSQWRFQPGSIPPVKMPFEFAGPAPGRGAMAARPARPASYWLLLLLGLGAVAIAASKFLSRRGGIGRSRNPFDA